MDLPATQAPDPALRITLAQTQPVMRAWALGQILQATVLRSDGRSALLEIAGQQVPARTPSPLTPGERLTLSVASLEPRVVLQRLPAQSAPSLPVLQKEALREALPRQLPLAESMAMLRSLASATIAGNAGEKALPGPVQRLIGQLLDTLPTPASLTDPKRLQRAIRNSGLFLEASLARAATDGSPPRVERDLKAALLRLLSALPRENGGKGGETGRATRHDSPLPSPSTDRSQAAIPPKEDPRSPMLERHLPHPQPRQPPPASQEIRDTTTALRETTRQVDGALARIEVHQAASANTSQSPAHALWLVELPVRDPAGDHALQLRIERDGRGSGEEAVPVWSLSFALDLGEHGPLHARVTLRGEALTTTLWAERDSTRELFQQRLSLLQEKLEQAGFHEPMLRCHCGRPHLPQAEEGSPLVSVRA